MSSLCCEPLVRAIISGMSVQGVNFRENSHEQIYLIQKACRLALITRWQGEHHVLFWKHEIGIVLLDLLKPELPHNLLWSDKRRLACILYTNKLLALRTCVWDVFGWLATHCEEDFNPEGHRNKSCIDRLTTSTWYCLILKTTCLFSRAFSCCVYKKCSSILLIVFILWQLQLCGCNSQSECLFRSYFSRLERIRISNKSLFFDDLFSLQIHRNKGKIHTF